MEWPMKGVNILSRKSGNEDVDGLMPGDVVEVETVGGYVMEVDPITYEAKDTRQRFKIKADGKSLKIPK